MVRPIYVPQAGRFVNFSDTASNDDIKSYIRTNFPKPEAVAPPAQEAVVPTENDQSTLMQRGIYGLVSGFTEIPGGIAALMYPAEQAAQTAAGKWSAGNRAYLQKQLNIDPTKEATTGQMLAQGLGSAVGFLVPGGAVAKGAGMIGAGARTAALAGSATVAGQGASLNAGARAEKIQSQLASGMAISPETQLSAQRLDGLIGLSEALPMHKFFGPLGALLSKVPASKAPIVEKIISSRVSSLIKAGTEEAAQEAASGIASDLMEYGVYNPDVQIGEDIASNAAGGAFAGTVLEGVIQLAAGRKLRGVRQLQADLRDEEQKNNADARRVNIAMASEELARAGAEGTLKVEENQAPDGNIRHTIMTSEGKPLADMQTADDAVQAIDLYKKKTGANVSVDVTTAPSLNPVKIGASRFPNIEAAAAEYEKIKGHVATLEKYAARPDLIQKEAEKRSVPLEGFKRQVADSLAYQRKRLNMFNAYFTAEEAAAPVAPAEQAPAAPGPTVAAGQAAPAEAAVAEAIPEAPAVAPVAAPEAAAPIEGTAEIPAEALIEETPEPITSEEQVPEMPIGAVELPIEESRVLPDTIVENEFVPESGIEPPPVRVEKRPSAGPEELMNLRTELFGSPIGWFDMTPEQKSMYEAERDKRFPPQDVTLYSAGLTKEPVPKTVRDATITGPMVKDYSPETQQWIKKVYDQLVARLGSIAPSDTTLRLKTLAGSRPGYLIRGQADMIDTPNGLKSVIDLSTGILQPDMSVEDAVKALANIMNHEVIHVLRDNGLIRPNEWRILTRAVANTNVPGKKYTYLDKAEAVYTPMGPDGVPVPISDVYSDPDAVAEEAVAEMYREWVINRNKPKEQNAVGLLNRITEFFRRIFQTFRNARHEEFFSRIEAGDIAARTPGALSRGTRYQASPITTKAAGFQDEDGVHIEPFPEDATTSSTAYLRENFDRFKAKGRRTDDQWGRAFDEAFLKKFGRTYDINEPSDYQQIVRSIADEVNLQMKQAQSGVGWYDSDIQDVFDELGKSFPILKDPADGPAFRQMFTMIAGVMSNGMKAKANVELAAINFAHFLNTGRFSETHPFTKTGWNQRSNIMGPQIAMLNRMIEDERFAPRPGSNNPRVERLENFLQFMFSEHTVREINAFRAAHGTKSPAKIGKFDEKRLGMYAFGPKFGPFILNLNGLSDETVDSWASRSFYRHMGRSIDPNGELYKAPLTSNREAMKRALRDVAALTNLSSRDIQAVLWFYEKELYNQLGQSIPLEVFSDGAREFNRKYGTGAAGPQQSRTDRERAISGAIKAAGTRTGQTIPSGPRFSAAPLVSSDEFKRWFRSSKVVNKDGSPKTYYHGTSTKTRFDAFAPGIVEFGTHFGTARQANNFVMDRRDESVPKTYGRIFPVYLSIQNPLRLIDTGSWNNNSISSQLYEKNLISRELLEEAQGKSYDDDAVKAKLTKAMRDAGYDGIVYLNRAEGINRGSIDTLEEADLDWQEIPDQQFRGYVPEAEDSYIIFDGRQAKSVFNKFEEGESKRLRFSAAPTPAYLTQQNNTLFKPAPNVTLKDTLFNYVFGHSLPTKTVRVNGRDIEISSRTMKAVAAKAAVVDNAAYIAELEKIKNREDTGNYQRQVADYSATAAIAWLRRASHVMASMMLRGNLTLDYATPGDILSATMKVTDDPDSLKEVFKIMTQPAGPDANGNPQTKADIFKQYAVARRGEWLKASGQTVPREITPQYVRQTIDFTQREYPEVVEAYNMYQRFNKKLMTTVRDAGLISNAELGRLTNQMNYYGFIYEAYGEPLGPSTGQKAASQFKLRPYTGTQHGGLVNDPMFVMIQNAQFMVTSVAKNLAAVKSFELAKEMGEARILQTGEAPNEFIGEQSDTMFFSRNGQVYRFAVKDPLLVTALGSDDRISVGKFWEVMGVPAHILRESVTRDPGFMARNLLRDTLSSWITSGVNFVPVVDTLKNFGKALKDSSSFQALGARGVVGSYDLAMQTPQELSATFKRNLPKNVHGITTVEQASNAARSLWNRLGHVSEASDAATRMAVYDALIAQGASEAEAAMQAIELLDFTRRGGSQTLGILTKLIPFLNARIQGMDVLYQAGRAGIRYATGKSLGERDANIGKKFLIRGGMLAALSMALELLNQDDEDYKELDDYIKNGNLLIPLKEFGLKGQFLAIPKPFEAGLLFSTFPQQIVKTLNGDASTRDNANLFFQQLSSTFGVNPIPQVLLPSIEIITNHSFYTGLPLISEGKLRLAPELQYNTSTSQLAMMIGGLPIFYDFTTGKFGGMSPIVIDKLISGYGGPVGSYMAMMIGLGMQEAEIGPERMPVELSNAPVVRSFFIDAKSKNPKVVTQAYELFRVADEANRTVSRLKQMRDAEALHEYVDKNRDILTYKKYIFTLVDRLNKLSAQERAVERSTTMSADEKIAAQQKLRDIRIRLASKVDEINKKLGR